VQNTRKYRSDIRIGWRTILFFILLHRFSFSKAKFPTPCTCHYTTELLTITDKQTLSTWLANLEKNLDFSRTQCIFYDEIDIQILSSRSTQAQTQVTGEGLPACRRFAKSAWRHRPPKASLPCVTNRSTCDWLEYFLDNRKQYKYSIYFVLSSYHVLFTKKYGKQEYL
jgi:hypothetical protein